MSEKARRSGPLRYVSTELLSGKTGAFTDRVPADCVQAVARIEDRVTYLRRGCVPVADKVAFDHVGDDLGGVEYLVNERTSAPTFYDVNALSNFVADATNVLGFDPFVSLVDLIELRAGERSLAPGVLA